MNIPHKIKLLAVIACFGVPLLIAFIGYYGFGGALHPSRLTNRAPLIQPPKPLKPFSATDLAGAPVTLDDLRGRWTLIHLLAADCDEACRQALYHTRQARLALGRRRSRVARLITAKQPTVLGRLQADHPHARFVPQQGGSLAAQLVPLFDESGASGQAILVDPLGNAMLRIPADMPPAELLKDLKRLLRLSRIG